MTNETTPPAETPQPNVETELKAHEVPEVLDFIRENGISVLVGIGLAVAVFLAFSAYRNFKKSASLSATDLLFKSQSVEQIQSVLNQYGSTPAAPLAQLALASAQFDAGQYELADYSFSEFQQKYPNHALIAQADLGRAQCKEASGQANEALEAFTQFATAHPDHYLRPMAIFGEARCQEQLGKFADAKATYEDFIAASPTNSPWISRAEASLLYLDKEARASKLPPATAAATPMMAPVSFPDQTQIPSQIPNQAPAPVSPSPVQVTPIPAPEAAQP